jgi:hypothetical protein
VSVFNIVLFLYNFSDKFTVDNGGFHKCVYENIQSLRNKDLKLFDFSLDECRLVSP